MYIVHTVDQDEAMVGDFLKLCSTIEIARDRVAKYLENGNCQRVAIFIVEVDTEDSEKFEVYEYDNGLVFKSEKSDKEFGYLSKHLFEDGYIFNEDVPSAVAYFEEYYQKNSANREAINIAKALLSKGSDGFYFELRPSQKKFIVDLYRKSCTA